ncbi:Uncharacterized protein dnm_099680 [Desulfonema magnum]|uniref:Uncharacterized protein n=1 Tax=Desulfonema magnum TaxID=45655 RepID=A0A975BYI1_9BACT|nr:Uncharacterized protein dnm_099680 [Desulfonema magnum]
MIIRYQQMYYFNGMTILILLSLTLDHQVFRSDPAEQSVIPAFADFGRLSWSSDGMTKKT